MIHEAHNKASHTITFQIISLHFLALAGSIHHAVISTHHITTITKENISIAVTSILLSDHISIGKALRAFTLVVLFEDSPPSISIQSHMKGTTVLSCIPQHHWEESQTHLSHFNIFPDGQTQAFQLHILAPQQVQDTFQSAAVVQQAQLFKGVALGHWHFHHVIIWG